MKQCGAIALGTSTVTYGALIAAIKTAGFGVAGIKAGSLAAIWQAGGAKVLKGSLFSLLQSMGAKGLASSLIGPVGIFGTGTMALCRTIIFLSE